MKHGKDTYILIDGASFEPFDKRVIKIHARGTLSVQFIRCQRSMRFNNINDY